MEAMIRFVDAYRDEHGVEPICRVLGSARGDPRQAGAHDGERHGTNIRIRFAFRRPRGLNRETDFAPGIDGETFATMTVDADRGALVAMNLEEG